MVDTPGGRVGGRREAILAAAQREFAAAGFSGSRIDRIAAAARVNKQLLFHYFGSKEGLFEAAVAALLEPLEAHQPRGGSPVELVRAYVLAIGEAARMRPGLVAMLADAQANPDFPRAAAQALGRWRDAVLSRLTETLADGQRRGYFRDDIDPGRVAAIVTAAVLGQAVLAPGQHGDPHELDGYLTHLVADHCAWR